MDAVKVIETGDGSHTLLDETINETYHSRHGAVQESQHVFIEQGLKHVTRNHNTVNLLEVGFGTGLNALLTLLEVNNTNFQISYTALETRILSQHIIGQLNYPSCVNDKTASSLLALLHNTPWNVKKMVTGNMALTKLQVTLQDFKSDNRFNLVYYDAFAPDKQAELWTLDCFKHLDSFIKPGGILVTYASKGQVRRYLESLGYTVERLPGPPGKAQMLRAKKKLTNYNKP